MVPTEAGRTRGVGGGDARMERQFHSDTESLVILHLFLVLQYRMFIEIQVEKNVEIPDL